MGAEQSVIGLRMMEVIYPAKGRTSIFSVNLKAKAALEKECKKRGITLDDLEPEEEAVDGDLDSEIERCVKKVWAVYDKKNQGALPKKIVEQFFRDTLELYAIRSQKKLKDIVKGDNKKAMAASIAKMSSNGSGNVTYQEFEQFVFTYDVDEALEAFFQQQGMDIDPQVQFVDVSMFTNQNREGPKLVYRDYPDD